MSDKHTARVQAIAKKKANSECFNCGDKGASLAVVAFGIFVCQTCGGIHREMQHRVKGVSASIFKEEEADFLESHGNRKERPIWFAYFDKSQNPDLSSLQRNAERLRPFLKLIFEDRKWHIDNPANKGKQRMVYPESSAAGGADGRSRVGPGLAGSSSAHVASTSVGSNSNINSDPFSFDAPAPAPAAASSPATSHSSAPSAAAVAPSAQLSARGRAGSSAAPAPFPGPGAGRLAGPSSLAPSSSRQRPRAGTASSGSAQQATAASGGGVLDSFDSYYGTTAPAASAGNSNTADPFGLGGLPGSSTAANDDWGTAGAGNSASFGGSAGSGASKRASVVDIMSSLGDLYAQSKPAAAPVQQPQIQQQQLFGMAPMATTAASDPFGVSSGPASGPMTTLNSSSDPFGASSSSFLGGAGAASRPPAPAAAGTGGGGGGFDFGGSFASTSALPSHSASTAAASSAADPFSFAAPAPVQQQQSYAHPAIAAAAAQQQSWQQTQQAAVVVDRTDPFGGFSATMGSALPQASAAPLPAAQQPHHQQQQAFGGTSMGGFGGDAAGMFGGTSMGGFGGDAAGMFGAPLQHQQPAKPAVSSSDPFASFDPLGGSGAGSALGGSRRGSADPFSSPMPVAGPSSRPAAASLAPHVPPMPALSGFGAAAADPFAVAPAAPAPVPAAAAPNPFDMF